MRSILSAFAIFVSAATLAQPVTDAARIATAEPLAGGLNHSLLIRKGTVYATGQNTYGQLGAGNKTDAAIPVQAGNGSNYTSVSANSYTSLALRADGSIWAWGFNNAGEVGSNSYGELGTGDIKGTMVPVLVK